MGAIAKTVASGWLGRIEGSRQQLIEAAKTGNRVLAAFAQADARAELIESLKDPEVSARLLKITDPELAMVELANNPTPDDRIRICAIAILSGFVPGDDQFAIFGGGRTREGGTKPGKLYTKEAGYRTLFGHLGIVPEVSVGYPEWLPLGNGKKNVWRVSGSASCTHNGSEISVTCVDDSAIDGGVDARISLPGYESDNVAGIAAKARRRLLQALWSKLSPILNEPQADDDEGDVVQAESAPKQITQQPAQIQSDKPFDATAAREQLIRDKVTCNNNYARAMKILAKDSSARDAFIEVWCTFQDATSAEILEAAGQDYAGMIKTFSSDVQNWLRKWYQVRQVEIASTSSDKE